MSVVVPEDFDYSASISFLEIRDQLPLIDPESLSRQDVLEIHEADSIYVKITQFI